MPPEVRPDLRVGVGFSEHPEPEYAARTALEGALATARPPSLALVVVAGNYDPEAIFTALRARWGDRPLLGTWAPGVIAGATVHHRGVGVLVLAGEGVRAATHLEREVATDPFQKGARAGRALASVAGGGGGTVLVFVDARATNVSELLRGLYDSLGPEYLYLGGGSGDHWEPPRAFQFTQAGWASGAVALALVRGIRWWAALEHGWVPTGEPLAITRAEGRRVYEIDGLPAFERYADLVEGCTRETFPWWGMRYPLGLPAVGGRFILRDPVAAGEDGSLLMVAEVPENSIAAVMKADAAGIIGAARRAVRTAIETSSKPQALLILDCVSRVRLLGPEAHREVAAMSDQVGAGIPVFGLLTFGEISSLWGAPLFYNKTVVATVVG
ncbi:MAG: FIST signal transduction protein [Moorellales bacterium]